jgi:hypothetical protein
MGEQNGFSGDTLERAKDWDEAEAMRDDGQERVVGGWAGWLLNRMRSVGRRQPRLALLERIALAPRQSLALVEAEGRRFLVATSAEGSPAFYALDERERSAMPTAASERRVARVSW